MAALQDNTSSIRALTESISALPADRYETGLEEGYTNGYADGRSSLDVLPTLESEKIGAYYGKRLDLFGGQKLVILITLKKGKTVPSDSFGAIYQSLNSGTSATWVVSDGNYTTDRAVIQITPSAYSWSMVGCYPGNQETWDAFMDAFDVRAELIQEEI